MLYKQYKPVPALQEYVKVFHLLHFDLKGLSISPTKTYFPHVEQCLTFDLRGQVTAVNHLSGNKQVRPSSYLSKQQITSYDLLFSEEYIMLKVVFHPGVLYRLLGVPLQELGEDYVDATLVMDPEIKHVNERLANATSYTEMIGIVESFFYNRIEKMRLDKHVVDSVNELLPASDYRFSLDNLARQVYLSPRQLERKYLERIGVSPGTYYRIIRFNRAFQMKEDHPSLTWLDVAISCAYADLRHLIKDFRQFSGFTPSELIREEANAIQHQLKLV